MSVAATGRVPGRVAAVRRGWLAAHRFLLLRRLAQLVFLAVFLTGPWFGLWIAKGTLATSLTFDVLPLTDPLVLLQSLAARHWPSATALIGAAIVLAAYLLVGGRAYCAWVCPINPVTDLAYWLRTRLGLAKGWQPSRATRFWLLGAVLVVSAVAGRIAWEAVNPITILQRGLLFGIGLGWIAVVAVFLFDLLVARHGWCGHLCPVGAFYGLLGKAAVLRVSAAGRARCDDCMDCYAVCPEPHVISPALRGTAATSPVILSGDCSNCGRCADVCPEDVFRFALRGDRREHAPAVPADVRKVA
ncbi:MAG: quinol dehydrogenase ferredoxin subunit NapH [Alphaproteobacteria bacterium]|nr:quinol dehydrogenase ferredoxin subunit NapH [Alphaproteobacteria bacterium]